MIKKANHPSYDTVLYNAVLRDTGSRIIETVSLGTPASVSGLEVIAGIISFAAAAQVCYQLGQLTKQDILQVIRPCSTQYFYYSTCKMP